VEYALAGDVPRDKHEPEQVLALGDGPLDHAEAFMGALKKLEISPDQRGMHTYGA